jgi:phosphate transport system permease protein
MTVKSRRFWGGGEPFIWLTGGALSLSLLLVVGLISLILYYGLGFFWPRAVLRATLQDGATMTGQVVEREPVPGKPGEYRIKMKVANRDLYGADFQWVDESRIARREYPGEVAVIERTEWGALIGTIKEARDGGQVVASGAQAWAEVERRLPGAARVRQEIRRIETREIGAINYEQEQVRLGVKRLELKGTTAGPAIDALKARLGPLEERYNAQTSRLTELRKGQTSTPWWSRPTEASRRNGPWRSSWTSASRMP